MTPLNGPSDAATVVLRLHRTNASGRQGRTRRPIAQRKLLINTDLTCRPQIPHFPDDAQQWTKNSDLRHSSIRLAPRPLLRESIEKIRANPRNPCLEKLRVLRVFRGFFCCPRSTRKHTEKRKSASIRAIRVKKNPRQKNPRHPRHPRLNTIIIRAQNKKSASIRVIRDIRA